MTTLLIIALVSTILLTTTILELLKRNTERDETLSDRARTRLHDTEDY